MLRFIARSLLLLLASAAIGSLIIFVLVRSVGGDIATVILGRQATPESIAALRAELGLDRPLWEQYFSWISGFATGDLGNSYGSRYDIAEQIVQRLEPTLILTFGSLLVSIPIALVVGLYSARNHTKWRGTLVDAGAQVGLAVPPFFVALVLVLVFAVGLRWFPAGDYVSIFVNPAKALHSMVLPIAALSLGIIATFVRFVRSTMIDQLDDDYMRAARARGRTLSSAAWTHGLRNAAIPLVTVGALQIGGLMAGAVIIENVFVLPGIGRLLLTSVLNREAIVVQSLVLVILLIILVMNFLMDLLYGVLDPRIRSRARKGS